MRLLYQLTFRWQKFALLFKSYAKILILASCNGGLSIVMPLGEGVQIMSHQGGITCGAIDEPRKSSKAVDERVIINFRDKNVVIARFRDKNVYR